MEAYFLDAADEAVFDSYFDEVDEEDLECIAQEHIADRGRTYYQEGAVKRLELSDHRIEAEVEGSASNRYQVQIWYDREDILGTCSCPYGDVCKHIIAVLLQAKAQTNEPKERAKQEKLHAVLQKLSHEELVTLVMQFAPESYRIKLLMQDASEDEVLDQLSSVRSEMEALLDDIEMLYSPWDFQDAASGLIEMLVSTVSTNPDETFALLFWFAKEIEELNNSGYLYQDDYYFGMDEYFDFEMLSREIMDLLAQIEEADMQARWTIAYALLCTASDYLIVDYAKIGVDPKQLRKQGLKQIKELAFYDYIKQELSLEEKMAYLEQFPSPEASRQIIDAYREHGDEVRAVERLRQWIAESFEIVYAEQLIEINAAMPEEICDFLKQALKHGGIEEHRFVSKYLDRCEDIDEILALMKKHQPYWYYDIMENRQQIEQMHAMLTVLPEKSDAFYMVHYLRYPKEAAAYFKQRINALLPYTGNNYYEAIIGYMKPLRKVSDDDYFRGLLYRLRTQFKRRRNFMKLLDQYYPQ